LCFLKCLLANVLKAGKIIGNILLLLLGVVLANAGLLAYKLTDHDFQTRLAQHATQYLSRKLGAHVSVARVEINFFNSASLNDVLLMDKNNDTLLHADRVAVSVGTIKLLQQQFEVDNVWIDKPEIYLHRNLTDTDWNFQFILDALSSKSTQKKQPSKLELALNSVRLNETHFVLLDEPNATKLDFAIPKLQIAMNQLDLNTPKFDMKKLLFDQADLKIVKLKENSTDTTQTEPDTGTVHINTKPLQLFIADFELKDSRFSYDDMNEKPDTSQFDGVHQSYSDLNLHLTHCSLVMDTIKAHAENISLKEKCGFVLNHLEADAKVTPTLASASHLKIETPYSSVKDSFSFSYFNFHAFYDFNSNVILSALLQQSTISLKDVGYFIGGIKGNSETLLATGLLRGSVDNMKGRKLKIESGSTRFAGNVELKGLPDAEETYINLDITQLTTNADELKKWLGQTMPDPIVRAGTLNFTGNFNGFYNDFVAYGTFNSQLGTLNSDLNMKFKNGIENAVYSGNLAADNFDLGHMVAQNSLLGRVSFALNLNGSGMNLKDIDSKMSGNVSEFDFNKYSYHNIAVNGTLVKKIFNGNIAMDDENAKFDFDGLVDFNKELPEYRFRARIDSTHLDKLHLTKDPYTMAATINMNLQGKNIDDFIGDVRVKDISFEDNGKKWSADSILLSIKEPGENAKRSLLFDGPMVHVDFNGRFALTQLPKSFLSLIDHYFPSLPGDYAVNDSLQEFDFHILLHHSSATIHYFLPDMSGIDSTEIHGHFSSIQHVISLEGNVPKFKYKNFDFGHVFLKGRTAKDSLYFSGGSKSLRIGDSLQIQFPAFAIMLRHDTATAFLSGTSRDSTSRIRILASITGDTSKVTMHILPSELVLNKRPWVLSENNLISYYDQRLVFDHFTLSNEDRSLTVSNVNLRVRATNLQFEFSKIPIRDFHELINVNNYDLEGDLSGTMEILNVFHEPRVDAGLVIHQFALNGTTIATANFNVSYEPESDRLSIASQLSDEDFDVTASGSIFPLKETDQLDLDIAIRRADPQIVESLFFQGLISQTHGSSNGTLHIAGTFKDPLLTGQVMLDSLSTKINYLQTVYHCSNTPIVFNSNNIDLGKFNLYDQNGDVAVAEGKILHDHLSNFNMNVLINTKRFMALNTTQYDDSIFYGKAETSGFIRFQGHVENIEITANVKSLSGTNISIPIYSSTSSGERSYIRYIQHNKDTTQFAAMKSSSIAGMKMNLNMDITPEAIIQIIFDQATGDIVKGSGSGNIRMDIDTKGEFNMYGQFTIEQGSYLFTQFNFFNKNFTIENGGTITWNGDPYEAKIDFSAIYTTRASLYELVPNTSYLTSDEIRGLQQRTRVDLYLILTGSLFAPEVSFDIKLPETSSLNTAATVELARLKQDENELNKQVFGLLVLGHFLPPESGLGGSSLGTEAANSLSSFLSSQISALGSSVREDIDFTVNYQSYEANINPSSSTDVEKRNELQVALTKRFFNDRLAVDVGGNLDFSANGTSSTNSTSNIAGDFAIEYKITPDGRVSGKVYSKSNYDYIDATNKQNNGVSLKYTREFDTLKDLFKDPDKQARKEKEKKQKEEQQQQQTPAQKPDQSDPSR